VRTYVTEETCSGAAHLSRGNDWSEAATQVSRYGT
jgi:hypothetical protein